MKILSYNEDLSIQFDLTTVTGEELDMNDFSTFDITVFTQNSNIVPQFNKEDLTEKVINIGSDILSHLPNGQIGLKFAYSYADSEYTDGKYDQVIGKFLDYYLVNDTDEQAALDGRNYYTKAETRNLLINLENKLINIINGGDTSTGE